MCITQGMSALPLFPFYCKMHGGTYFCAHQEQEGYKVGFLDWEKHDDSNAFLVYDRFTRSSVVCCCSFFECLAQIERLYV